MCLICVDLIKQKLTLNEAMRNAQELGHTEVENWEQRQHYQDLHDAIYDGDLERLDEVLKEGE